MSGIAHQQQALRSLRAARTSLEKAQNLGAPTEEERSAVDALVKILAAKVRLERLARLKGRAA